MSAAPARRPPRGLAVLGALTLALAVAGCDRTAPGREAWDAGRAGDALSAWNAAAAEAGDAASPELLYDLALAALRTGDFALAATSADAAARRGGEAFGPLRDAVHGSVAFARSEAMEVEAGKPGAPPTTMDKAIALAEDALAAWRAAAASRADWPPVRRNVERALLRLERLRERRAEAQRRLAPPPPPTPPPSPTPPPAIPDEQPPPPKTPDPASKDLAPAEVLRLLEVLGEKERQKGLVRRAHRNAPGGDVEKDW